MKFLHFLLKPNFNIFDFGGKLFAPSQGSSRLWAGEWLLLGIYGLVISVTAFYHEPWLDEVRALNIAKTAQSLPHLLQLLDKEGHPPLWYALLMAGYAVFQSNTILPWLTWVVSLFTGFLFLRYAPFSYVEKALILFSTYPIFQYSVVSRSYCLSALFFIFIGMSYRYFPKHSWKIYGALFLLAITHVLAAVFSGAITAYLVLQNFSCRKKWQSYILPALVFVSITGVFLFVTPDSDFTSTKFFRLKPSDIAEAVSNILTSPAAPFSKALWGGEILIPEFWLLLFILYFANCPRKLFIVLGTVLVLNIFHTIIYKLSIQHFGMMFYFLIIMIWFERVSPAPVPAYANASWQKRIEVYRKYFFPVLFLIFLSFQDVYGFRHVRLDIKTPYSNSKNFAEMVMGHPEWKFSTIIAEPDHMAESASYYIDNPRYLPRAGAYRAWTTSTKQFKKTISLGELLNSCHQIRAETGKPVILLLNTYVAKAEKKGKSLNYHIQQIFYLER